MYAGYESLKARADGVALLDFDDLLLHTAAAIENDAAVAEEFRDRYRCFVVDEYQDVTPLQQRVLSPGWAIATTSPWSATPTRPSTRSPGPRRAICWTSPGVSRRDCGAPGARLPVHAAGGVAGQPGDRVPPAGG